MKLHFEKNYPVVYGLTDNMQYITMCHVSPGFTYWNLNFSILAPPTCLFYEPHNLSQMQVPDTQLLRGEGIVKTMLQKGPILKQ